MSNRFAASRRLAIAPGVPRPGRAQAQGVTRPSQDIVLSMGRGELITVPGTMADVFVANDAIADVQVKSRNQLYLFGKAGGETTVYASNAAGDVIWAANVTVGSNIGSISQMLTLAMPDAQIASSTLGNNTVLLLSSSPHRKTPRKPSASFRLSWVRKPASSAAFAWRRPCRFAGRFAEVSRSLVRDGGANLISADSTDGFQFGVTTGRGAFPPQPGAPAGTGVTGGADGLTVIDEQNRVQPLPARQAAGPRPGRHAGSGRTQRPCHHVVAADLTALGETPISWRAANFPSRSARGSARLPSNIASSG